MPMTVEPLFPWQDSAWQALLAYTQTGRVPQALLLSGPVGIGKTVLADCFAHSLLCQAPMPTGFACRACASCQLYQAGTHPDSTLIEPEQPGQAIRVDTVRQLTAMLALTPQYPRHRVVVFRAAQQLNTAAANSLLKTLEEPAERTVILLLSSQPDALPATIVSRCQRLSLRMPEPESARAWLQTQGIQEPQAVCLLAVAHGAPLRALQLSRGDSMQQRAQFFQAWLQLGYGSADPLQLAEHWSKTSSSAVIDWLLSGLMDMIRLLSHPKSLQFYNPDHAADLQQVGQRLSLKQLFTYLDSVQEAKRLVPGQLNQQLLLEKLLLEWCLLQQGSG